MTYFKVIKNDKVIDAGCVFLKWNTKRRRLYVCDVNDGQFVQSYNEKTVYRDEWLRPYPEDEYIPTVAKIEIIDKDEYDEIIELISDGEDIPVVVEVPKVETHNEITPPAEEKQMSISEMRELIIQQQKQIEQLMERFS